MRLYFSDDWFLDSLHQSFLNQTTLDLRKEKWTFLNREFTVLCSCIRYVKCTSPNNGADGVKNSKSIRGQVRLLGIQEYLVFSHVYFLERRLLWLAFTVKAHVEINLLPFKHRRPMKPFFIEIQSPFFSRLQKVKILE